MNPKRGEIWWVNLGPMSSAQGREIRKHRPCVVVSADWLNRHRQTSVVVPLGTSAHAAPPIVVPVTSAGPRSVAIVDQVRAVDKRRFTRTRGRLAPHDMEAIEEALRLVLNL